MSRKNQFQPRRNNENRFQNEPSSQATESNEPNNVLGSRYTPPSDLRETSEDGGGDVRACAQMISRYPVASLALSFSAGFGLGVLAIALLSRGERRWWERYELPESLQHISSTLRRLPGMISEQLPRSLGR